MKKFIAQFAILSLIGCGHKKAEAPAIPTSTQSVLLATKQAAWLAELRLLSDQKTGWPSIDDCDSTLWAGLARTAGAASIDLGEVEPSPGAIVRNPFKPCSPSSRDMILGYASGRWAAGDLGALQRLANYGEAHSWFMSANAELSYIDPSNQGLLGRMIEKLSNGADKRSYRNTPFICLPLSKDYEQHLEVIDTLLDGEVDSHHMQAPRPQDIPGSCFDVIRNFAHKSPDDGLFAAAAGVYTGDMTPAFSLLLDDSYQCPSYVRGAPTYCLIHKAFAAYTVLRHFQ